MFAAALAAISKTFAITITYRFEGQEVEAKAVLYHPPASELDGLGGATARSRGYEIARAGFALTPRNGAQIVENGVIWRVIEVIDYEEASAWRLMVERQG